MEIQKVLRILTLFITAAAFAIHVASRLLFPESSGSFNLPIMIVLLFSVSGIWDNALRTKRQNKNSNE